MKKTPIFQLPEDIPAHYLPLLADVQIYDSSCSEAARVYYIDKDNGCYLKAAPKGSLQQEAQLARFFHEKGLGAQVLDYHSSNRDWLLTRKVPGEDCVHKAYRADPMRLSQTLGELLRSLHETDPTSCPVPDRTKTYLDTVYQSYHAGSFSKSAYPNNQDYDSFEAAWQTVQQFAPCLKTDVLLHGDYCLPNILLDNWAFSGFIDLGCGGIGDRHIDLYWGAWSLWFNLKTDRYCTRFLDAYGRDKIEPELFRAIGAFECFG